MSSAPAPAVASARGRGAPRPAAVRVAVGDRSGGARDGHRAARPTRKQVATWAPEPRARLRRGRRRAGRRRGERQDPRPAEGHLRDDDALEGDGAAHFTYVDEVDCENLHAAREKLAKAAEQKGVKLTYLAFIAKATLLALQRFPKMNARVDDQAMELVLRKHVHLGIAAATEPGLVVPVVKHADRMTLLELAFHIQGLGDRARANTLKPDELKGSTFTITSLGKLGGLMATPIINHPEVGILSVHAMQKRAVVLDDGADTIVARRRMNLSLSFDHRVIDGHEGAAFAQVVKAYLEDPELMLLEMA
ncbi:MAG: 2-oxo acid dehydrogenase subunit E2 [Myxococcota bacterium]